jgi:UDP-glucose 4-epimerase
MAVMVTGTGFIGSYVIRDLVARGEDVVLFGQFGGRGGEPSLELPDLRFADELIGGGLFDRTTVIVGDVTDAASVLRAVEQNNITSIVHLASMMTSAAANSPVASIRVNAEGTANIFEAAAQSRVEKVVWASSIGVYGPSSVGPDGKISDTSLYDPRNLYGATKVLCEQLATTYADTRGLDVTGLRPGRVYGYGEHVKAARGSGSSWLMRLLHDAVIGSEPVVIPYGEKNLDFHYVEDVSSAFVTALNSRGRGGESYLIHGDYRPISSAYDYVRGLIPEANMVLTEGPADLPKNHSVIWSYPFDASRAEADLGVRSEFDMETGVLRTVNGYRRLAGLPELCETAR